MGGSVEKDVQELKERRAAQSAYTSKGTRRRRTRTTSEQLSMLEESFAKDNMPDKEERLRLVELVGMSYKQIVVWFQNRRAKERGDERKLYFSANRNSASGERMPNQRVPDQFSPTQQHRLPASNSYQHSTESDSHSLKDPFSKPRSQVSSPSVASTVAPSAPNPLYPTRYGEYASVHELSQRDNAQPSAQHPHAYYQAANQQGASPEKQRVSLNSTSNPSSGWVLPTPAKREGLMSIGNDLLKYSLTSGRFQSHVPTAALPSSSLPFDRSSA